MCEEWAAGPSGHGAKVPVEVHPGALTMEDHPDLKESPWTSRACVSRFGWLDATLGGIVNDLEAAAVIRCEACRIEAKLYASDKDRHLVVDDFRARHDPASGHRLVFEVLAHAIDPDR